jgi:DNA invertase Pin-like site-specific DNA recombinase
MSTPAVIYAAKSTADLRGSIPDQLIDGRQLAASRALEVVAEFTDEAASAYHGDRGPGLADALAECERLSAEHGTCALIVQHSDRLARGDAKQARHLIEIVVWAIKTDVQLLSVQDPEMLSGGEMGLLMGVIGGMRNHQDSKRKGLAVKGGIKRRAVDRRQFIGGRRPYGYRHRDTTEDGRGTGPLVIEPREATVVRRIFDMYLARRVPAEHRDRAERRRSPDVDRDSLVCDDRRRDAAQPAVQGVGHARRRELPGADDRADHRCRHLGPRRAVP